MYKNLEFGNSSGDYDASDLVTALRRQQLSMAFNILMPGPRLIWQFEELGYDYSINTCSDGVTINEDCRLPPSPCGGITTTTPNVVTSMTSAGRWRV